MYSDLSLIHMTYQRYCKTNTKYSMHFNEFIVIACTIIIVSLVPNIINILLKLNFRYYDNTRN